MFDQVFVTCMQRRIQSYYLLLCIIITLATQLIHLDLSFAQSIDPKELRIAPRANALFLKMDLDEKTLNGWIKNQNLAQTKKLSSKDLASLIKNKGMTPFDMMIIMHSNQIDINEQILILDEGLSSLGITNIDQTIDDLETATLLIIEMNRFLMNDQIDIEIRKNWLLPKISQIFALCDNLIKKAEYYAIRPEKKHLFALQKTKGRFPGEQWLLPGDLPYVLNVILVPAAFKAMLDLLEHPRFSSSFDYLNAKIEWIKKSYEQFSKSSMHFELKVGYLQARGLVRKASQCWQFSPKVYASEIVDDITFFAIGLRSKLKGDTQPKSEDFDLIRILHPNPLMIFQFFPAEVAYENHPLLKAFFSNLTRLYPAGLLTPQGLINSSAVFEEKHPFYEGCQHLNAEKLLEEEQLRQQPDYTAYHPALSTYFQQIDHWYQAWLIDGIFAVAKVYQNTQKYIPPKEMFAFGDLAFFLYFSLLYRLDEIVPFDLSKQPLSGIQAEDKPNPLFLYQPIPLVKQLPSKILNAPLPKLYERLY